MDRRITSQAAAASASTASLISNVVVSLIDRDDDTLRLLCQAASDGRCQVRRSVGQGVCRVALASLFHGLMFPREPVPPPDGAAARLELSEWPCWFFSFIEK